ncbi:WXG100 family type VII secretion target [Listeria booriae]|uniref:WXG100 family type VII secretion target n=1 Tax=Listeria booriae TaxID=1552123 RepID=A0A7X0Z3F9_9LIST|nr:WXG100 family type VII secretion target [Listeria booriae]MBC2175198.1 WXG100 family type VII secretion target [Listeria booriae]MBC2390510.1 WXG100 family type VII secretion target [Listeria booriae]
MADKVTIYGDKVGEARTIAKEIDIALKNSYDDATSLKSYVNGVTWKGKSKKAFVAYLDIIVQYHKDVKSAMKEQTKALENLEKYIEAYDSESKVREVKNL